MSLGSIRPRAVAGVCWQWPARLASGSPGTPRTRAMYGVHGTKGKDRACFKTVNPWRALSPSHPQNQFSRYYQSVLQVMRICLQFGFPSCGLCSSYEPDTIFLFDPLLPRPFTSHAGPELAPALDTHTVVAKGRKGPGPIRVCLSGQCRTCFRRVCLCPQIAQHQPMISCLIICEFKLSNSLATSPPTHPGAVF